MSSSFYHFTSLTMHIIFHHFQAEIQRQRDINVSLKNTISGIEIDHKIKLQELETAKSKLVYDKYFFIS